MQRMKIEFVFDNSTLTIVEDDVIPRKGDRIRMDMGGGFSRPTHYLVDEVMWVYPDVETACTTVLINLLRLG